MGAAMTLNAEPRFTSRRTYVIRVRSDARPYALSGRVENLVTGRHSEFSSGHELLTSIVKDIEADGHGDPAAPTAR